MKINYQVHDKSVSVTLSLLATKSFHADVVMSSRPTGVDNTFHHINPTRSQTAGIQERSFWHEVGL